MSHFTVMLVTEKKPSEKDLEKLLAPYYDTGIDDEYVQNVDLLPKMREEYKDYKKSWEPKHPSDTMKSFSEFVKNGYTHFDPIGPTEPTDPKTHKYGWIRVDENGEVIELIDRTNPNAKWDWWVIGGRWSGFFKLKPLSRRSNNPERQFWKMVEDVGYLDESMSPEIGVPDTFGSKSETGFDIIRKGDVDFEGMQETARIEARKLYRKVMSVVGDLNDHVSWEAMRSAYGNDYDVARHAYLNQRSRKAIIEMAQKEENQGLLRIDLDTFTMSEEDFVERQAKKSIATFAVLKDGKWAQQGEMGWWDCVSDENENWEDVFHKILKEIPADRWLSIVDCYI